MNKIVYNILLISLHFVMINYVNQTGSKFYNDRIEQQKIIPKIYDIGIRYTPNLSQNDNLKMFSHFVAIGLPLMFGETVLKTYVQFWIVISIIRYIFSCITILPKDKSCDDTFSFTNYFMGHCYDKIFSAHFASVILLSLILYDKGIIKSIPLIVFLNLCNAFLILSLRSHYSIDLLVAILVTVIVYQNNLKLEL